MSATIRMTAAQVARFREATRGLDCAISIANSAGVFSELHLGCDWVRPGLALYGASPFADRTGADLGLQPVMSLETSVIAVRHVPRGETVGYGGTWQAQRDSKIAIVAAGYGDGLARGLPSGTPVLVDGSRAPLVRPSVDGHDCGGRDGAAGRAGRQPGGAMGAGTCRWRKSPATLARFPTSCSAASASACRWSCAEP